MKKAMAAGESQPGRAEVPQRALNPGLFPVRPQRSNRTQENFDQPYIDALIEGSPAVVHHFTEYFGDLLFLKVRSQVRSAQVREDIVQETFLRVISFLKRGHLDHPERLGAFVYRVCDNITKEYFRKSGRDCPAPETPVDLPDNRIDNEARLVTEERKRQVRKLLDSMSEKDGRLLRMVFLEDRDKEEVCREFNVDRNYLRVLLHRAKAKFRENLENQGFNIVALLLGGI